MNATKTPAEIVAQVANESYGPEGDAELYAAARRDAGNQDPTVAELLDAAAWMRDLNGEGVYKLMVAAVEADRAQRADVPAYNVGDPDPTPDGDGEQCEATREEGYALWACTWRPNHPGVSHVAGDGEKICAVWP